MTPLIRRPFAGTQGVGAFGPGGEQLPLRGRSRRAGLEFSMGFDLSDQVRGAILQLE
jgi:hypothetical protein